MDTRLVAESAAVIAAASSHLIANPAPISDRVLHAYWQCARQRVQYWLTILKNPTDPETLSLENRSNGIAAPAKAATEASTGMSSAMGVASVLEDIFVSEMLTRVTTAVIVAADQQRDDKLAEPIVRNAFVAYLDCRGRALQRLVNETVLPMPELSRIERMRRRAEHWTDILLGPLLLRNDVAEFAFDGRRAREYGEQFDASLRGSSPVNAWDVTLAALRIAFPHRLPGSRPLNVMQQRQIATSLACFPSLAFDSDGLLLPPRTGHVLRSGLHAETARPPHGHATLIASGPGSVPIPTPRKPGAPQIRFAAIRRSQ